MGVESQVSLIALPGFPIVQPQDDLSTFIETSLAEAGLTLTDGDILVVASKVVSRAEDRFVELDDVTVSAAAAEIAERVQKDPRLVQLILSESSAVSREAPGVLIVRHRLGLVSANAAIDTSNAAPADCPEDERPNWVLLLPVDPDKSAEALRDQLATRSEARIGVIISDSLGRPFRLGTVGAAIGVAGVPALWDQRGAADLHGKTLEYTFTALADQVAAAADMVAGQAGEGRAVVLVRGITWDPAESSARDLVRDPETDLFA